MEITQRISLEQEFLPIITKKIDENLIKKPPFLDYRIPNEFYPSRMKEHLTMSNRGIEVIVGSERALFAAALSDEEHCEGIVGRDIHPLIKLYLDCAILLFRLSKTREEFLKFSLEPKTFEEKEREIREVLEISDIPEYMKIYYKEVLDWATFAYFSTNKKWQENKDFDVPYYKDDALFYKIQRYAKTGNFISTLGDIGDVEFLNSRNIELIDTSNVREYAVIHFQTKSIPKILWTDGLLADLKKIHYYSTTLDPLSPKEKEITKEILQHFNPQHVSGQLLSMLGNKDYDSPNRRHYPLFYCKKFFVDLKKFIETEGITFPEIGWIYLRSWSFKNYEINKIALPILRNFIRANKMQLTGFSKDLVNAWRYLNIETYYTFCQIPGWQEAFTDLLHQKDEWFQKKFSFKPLISSTQ